jgi:hypothetical protein
MMEKWNIGILFTKTRRNPLFHYSNIPIYRYSVIPLFQYSIIGRREL